MANYISQPFPQGFPLENGRGGAWAGHVSSSGHVSHRIP